MTTTMWRTFRLLRPAYLWNVVNFRVDPVLRGAAGRAPVARRRLGDGRCCRRDGFSGGCPGGHAGADVGAEAAAILIHTHGHGTNCDDSACPDRGN